MTDNGINQKVIQLKAQVAALEQLLVIDEQAGLKQADKLEQALNLLQQAYDQVPARLDWLNWPRFRLKRINSDRQSCCQRKNAIYSVR